MKHIYPAYELDRLYLEHREKYTEIKKRVREVREEFQNKVEPEKDDPEYINLIKELKEIQNKIDEEFYKVIQEYKELFSEFYITIEEVQTMFDLDVLYVERHILPNVSTLYLNRHVRKYIKSCHRNHMECELDNVLRHCDVDYEKKVFINKKDLEQWMFNHFESDSLLITEMMIKYCLQDRKIAVMHSTKTTKKKYGLKYNMQLQRLGLSRIYIKASEDKKHLSRVPSSKLLSFMLE